jgi:16S rRNA (adenine1518-N6/adenine1519-N6)-dimethyltransferase
MEGRSKRSLGQNFLVDQNVAVKIVASLQTEPGEIVLEIGPGNGALTGLLAQRARRVLALEKDLSLARRIKGCWPEIGVIGGDALRFDWRRLEGRVDRVVGNLPYNVASPIMWELARSGRGLRRLVFTVQKEVAQRVASPPGSREYGGLSVWMQSFVRVRHGFEVSRNVFQPRPGVTSAVLILEPRPVSERPADPDSLSRLIHLCFQKRRKQLARILRERWNESLEDWLRREGLDRRHRPEDLSPAQFESLSRVLAIRGSS